MKVDLPSGFDFSLKVSNGFISEFDFIRFPIDHRCFHSILIGDILRISIDSITHDEGILDGPNGVLKKLALKDGSFIGSIPHDVIWEFARELAKRLYVDEKKIRKFGDNIYCTMSKAYGGNSLWTKLARRFCFRVAFPFGNFLKYHSLSLPHCSAPLIVILLFPIVIWMFLFNRGPHKLNPIDLEPVEVFADGKFLRFDPKQH